MKSTRWTFSLFFALLLVGPLQLWGADDDADGLDSAVDNCPLIANATQDDLDGDNLGDLCDQDIDGDGLRNPFEEDVLGTDPMNWDSDDDEVADFFDCFPLDGSRAVSSSCDRVIQSGPPVMPPSGSGSVDPFGDEDQDEVVNEDDNCPFVFNPGQQDTDQDGVGDTCDLETQAAVPPEDQLLNGVVNGEGGCSLARGDSSKEISFPLIFLLLLSLPLMRHLFYPLKFPGF